MALYHQALILLRESRLQGRKVLGFFIVTVIAISLA
jgi:hypothetical protein